MIIYRPLQLIAYTFTLGTQNHGWTTPTIYTVQGAYWEPDNAPR